MKLTQTQLDKIVFVIGGPLAILAGLAFAFLLGEAVKGTPDVPVVECRCDCDCN